MAVATSSPAFDVAVVGAGLAGLAAALGLARAGLRVVCVGRPEPGGASRTVALLGRSLDVLADLGLREEVEAIGAPLRVLRIVDATGSLFAPAPVEFRASELGLDAFGVNVENAALAPLFEAAMAGVARERIEVAGFDFGPDAATLTLSDGRHVTARLIVGADGRASPARKAASVDMSARGFDQRALTLILRHSRPHGDASTEFHTREGPFTLVPLPGKPEAPHRSSLVWLMRPATAVRLQPLDDASLAEAVRAQADAMLGDMAVEGARGAFPMTVQRVARLIAPRLALIGDAAHVFPPIGAQGLNLGLRDGADLVAALREARSDPGGAEALAVFERRRRADVATRTLAVGALNLSLLAPFAPVDLARGLGLAALGASAPLRRFAMREGLSPFLAR